MAGENIRLDPPKKLEGEFDRVCVYCDKPIFTQRWTEELEDGKLKMKEDVMEGDGHGTCDCEYKVIMDEYRKQAQGNAFFEAVEQIFQKGLITIANDPKYKIVPKSKE